MKIHLLNRKDNFLNNLFVFKTNEVSVYQKKILYILFREGIWQKEL